MPCYHSLISSAPSKHLGPLSIICNPHTSCHTGKIWATLPHGLLKQHTNTKRVENQFNQPAAKVALTPSYMRGGDLNHSAILTWPLNNSLLWQRGWRFYCCSHQRIQIPASSKLLTHCSFVNSTYIDTMLFKYFNYSAVTYPNHCINEPKRQTKTWKKSKENEMKTLRK